MSALSRLRLAHTFDIEPLLFRITAINAVCEHRYSELRHPLDEPAFKLKNCRMATGTLSTIVLTLMPFTGKE